MTEEPLAQPPLDVLLAALCYLMSRYAANRCPALAEAVARHFMMLARHPDCRSEVLANMGQRLARYWETVVKNRPDHRGLYH
ncbi:MAG: hypothetical protein ACREYE_28365 [Gammaproteobacteria bacterium]